MSGKAARTHTLAVIPARGASKRIPGKNLRPLAGKALLLWTIDAARHARSLDRIVVSTDDQAIARFARKGGVEVPFLRPANLATDTSAMIEVIRHAVQQLEAGGMAVKTVVTLQPTSPLRTAEDIDNAVELFATDPGRAVVSVSPVVPSPDWWVRIEDGTAVPLAGQWPSSRSQDLPPTYALNGAIFVTPRSLLDIGSLSGVEPRAYVMPRERSIDIDEESDWRLAEALLADVTR